MSTLLDLSLVKSYVIVVVTWHVTISNAGICGCTRQINVETNIDKFKRYFKDTFFNPSKIRQFQNTCFFKYRVGGIGGKKNQSITLILSKKLCFSGQNG